MMVDGMSMGFEMGRDADSIGLSAGAPVAELI